MPCGCGFKLTRVSVKRRQTPFCWSPHKSMQWSQTKGGGYNNALNQNNIWKYHIDFTVPWYSFVYRYRKLFSLPRLESKYPRLGSCNLLGVVGQKNEVWSEGEPPLISLVCNFFFSPPFPLPPSSCQCPLGWKETVLGVSFVPPKIFYSSTSG